MYFYVLPGAGIYGGVKKGFHCAEILSDSGHPCVVATPGAERPSWFDTTATVVERESLSRRCGPADTVLFSCPADAPFVDGLAARRKIVHMQGANTPADHALFPRKRRYEFISHGLHMTYQLQLHGRVAPYVPLGIRDFFRWKGEPKRPGTVAVMPRKGGDVVAVLRRALGPRAEVVVIDGLSEREVARCLLECDVFVAISTIEAFGLPPLEAMSAGCCVVGYPGDGGFEFLRHGDTAHVVPNGDRAGLVDALREVLDRPDYREALRARGHELAGFYTLERERAHLLRALGLGDTP